MGREKQPTQSSAPDKTLWEASRPAILILGVGFFWFFLIVFMGSRFGFPNWPIVAFLALGGFGFLAVLALLYERWKEI